MIWESQPVKIQIQHGSKSNFIFHNLFLINRFGTNGRQDPKRNDWPGPGDTNVPLQPTDKTGYTNGRRTKFPTNLCPKPGEKLERKEEPIEHDGLGPGAYQVKLPNNVP